MNDLDIIKAEIQVVKLMVQKLQETIDGTIIAVEDRCCSNCTYENLSPSEPPCYDCDTPEGYKKWQGKR